MGEITKSNLFSEARDNVVDLIKDNVSDPISSSVQYRKWIYSREADVKASDFAGYPFIIVNPSEVNIREDGASLDGKSKFVDWVINVEIITSDRGYKSKDGQGLSHIDTISNSLISVFNDKTHRNTLSSHGMRFSNPQAGGMIVEPLDNELTYHRTILLPFKIRMSISD